MPTRNEAYSRCDRGTDRLTSEKVAVDITVSLALAASSLAIWFYLVAVRGRFWHGLERDDLDPLSASASWPPVTAVVPARNEADSMRQPIVCFWPASIHAACMYRKAPTFAMKPGRSDLPLIGFPKTLRRFVCKGYVAIKRRRNAARLAFCCHGNINSANT